MKWVEDARQPGQAESLSETVGKGEKEKAYAIHYGKLQPQTCHA
jgi:hypothetical protein